MPSDAEILGQGELAPDRLSAANIHPETGLATDYLNHFNEVVMMIEMLPDMPDCLDDVLDWQPTGYVEHFERSGFAAKELAIKAYHAAPHAIRSHLETVIQRLNISIVGIQSLLKDNPDPDSFTQAAARITHEVQPLLLSASGAIHGRIEDICELETAQTQHDIDALFD